MIKVSQEKLTSKVTVNPVVSIREDKGTQDCFTELQQTMHKLTEQMKSCTLLGGTFGVNIVKLPNILDSGAL